MAYTTIADAVKTLSKLDGMQTTLSLTAVSTTKSAVYCVLLRELTGSPYVDGSTWLSVTFRRRNTDASSVHLSDFVQWTRGMHESAAIRFGMAALMGRPSWRGRTDGTRPDSRQYRRLIHVREPPITEYPVGATCSGNTSLFSPS